jgi:molybdenum cofactor guanylyltransferase
VRYDAVILAGGQGSRLGGIDKAQLMLAGSPLVERPLAAAAGAGRIVLVGPDSLARDGVLLTREDPPGGGPAAATAAGLNALVSSGITTTGAVDSCSFPDGPAAGDWSTVGPAPWILLLSCDLPLAPAGVPHLLSAAPRSTGENDCDGRDVDGYCLTDADGRLQWLFALYRTASLLRAVRECGTPTGTSMRKLLAGLNLVGVPDTAAVSADLDTWDDHTSWTERLENT